MAHHPSSLFISGYHSNQYPHKKISVVEFFFKFIFHLENLQKRKSPGILDLKQLKIILNLCCCNTM